MLNVTFMLISAFNIHIMIRYCFVSGSWSTWSNIWIICNVYTIRPRHVAFSRNVNCSKTTPKLRKKEKFKDRLRNFKSSLGDLLDIKCNGRERIKS